MFDIKKKFLLFAILAPIIAALSACSSEVPGTSVPGTITGVVSAPAADKMQFAAARPTGFAQRLIDGVVAVVAADVTGLEPVGYATVELVRLDSQGNVISVLDSVVSDASGAYTFTNTPAPSSTLAVRVTGQPDVMRALVTGAQVDISPISEVVTDTVISSLTGGAILENYELSEIDALTALTKGMDIDLSALSFAQAVSTIKSASTPILPNLASGFSGPGIATVLHLGAYGAIDFSPRLKDPFTLGVSAGGVDIGTGEGGFGFGINNWIGQGTVFELRTLHNLSAVQSSVSGIVDLTGLPHIVTAKGQVIVSDTRGNGTVAGALTSDGSLMVYPIDTSGTGFLGRGLRLTAKKAGIMVDNSLLDGAGGAGTSYNLVKLKETVSGLLSNLGANEVELTTETGRLTFDSSLQTQYGGSIYGGLATNTLTTHPLAVDLDTYAVTNAAAGTDSLAGTYHVFTDGGLLFRNPDGTFLGQGFATGDGKVLTFTTSSDLLQLELDVLANDSDADVADNLTITQAGVVQPPSLGGTVRVGPGGRSLLYIPPSNTTGTETFSYTVSDGTTTRTAYVSLNLVASNTTPTPANDSSFHVAAGSSSNLLDVLANDSDPDIGNSLTIIQAGGVQAPTAGGTVSVNGAGDRVVYTPAPGYTGTESFSYTVSDGTATATATVTVDVVSAGNTSPVAGDDSGLNVAANSSNNALDVLANDSDADAGDSLTISGVGAASAGGTVTVNATNDRLLYTPAADYTGTETFSYTASDGRGGTATATVTVTVVAPGNTAPVAGDDSGLNVAANSTNNPLIVLTNDSDADVGDTLTITQAGVVTPPDAGGAVAVNGTGDRVLYTPPAGFSGTEHFSYTISDSAGATATATVTVNVLAPGNTAPVAADDSYSVAMDSSNSSLTVLANDSDADVGDTLTVSAVGATSAGGTVTNNGGSLSYSPAFGFSGTETFSYTVQDAAGATATANVTITVLAPADTAPVAVNDSGFSVAQDSSNNVLDVLANDSDPDLGDTVTITAVGATSNGGTVTNNGGNLSYAPAAGYTGTESFSYTISDAAGTTAAATVTVTVVAPADTAPVAANDSSYSVGRDSSNNVLDVLANDSDADVGDTLTISAVGATSAGGTVTNNGGNLSYSPAAGYAGLESFTYTISDAAGQTATATVTVIVVAPANTAPVAVDDSGLNVAVNSVDNPLIVLANDSDPDVGDSISITQAGVVTPPAHGTVTVNASNDRVLYTPYADYTGSDSFSYTITDGTTTATATVTVNVAAAGNTAPAAADDSYSVAKNSGTKILSVLANDSDADVGDTLTITAVGATSNGGTATTNGATVSYTPAAGFSGTETFSYTISDAAGATSTATVTVTLVAPANTTPTAAADSYSVGRDSSNNVLDVLANDSDPDVGDTLTITAVGATSNGGTVTNNGGNLSYAPAAGYTGTESFSYTVSDAAGATANATVTVTVTAPNTAPVAVNDSGYSVARDSSGNTLDVLANDSDPDLGDTLTITGVGATSNGGTVTNNGTNLSYAPAAGYTGTESFSYTVSDGTATANATVTVTVIAPANSAPIAVDDTGLNVAVNSIDNPLIVLGNDSDPDVGDSVSITQAGVNTPPTAGGTVTVNGTNDRVLYTPAGDFTGTESFSYTIGDGKGGTATATVTVNVIGAGNTAPVANDDSYSVARNSATKTLDLLANDSDSDVPAQTLTITAVGATDHGGTVTNNGSNVSYTPAAGYTGTESFSYTVSDGTATATGNVTVTVVAPANTAPAANADSYSVAKNSGAKTLDVLANDSDPDLPAQTLTISAVGATDHGGTVTNNGSNVSYTPAADFSGTETFSYTVSDGTATANATVTITVVAAANTAPTAADDGSSVIQDSSGNVLDVLANDSDPDLPAQALTITAVGATSAGGTVTNNGTNLSYAPAATYTGPETFTYTVSDGVDTATATVTVTVLATGGNTPPVAVDDSSYSVIQDSTGNVLDVLANDSDADVPAQALTITAVGATSAGGTVTNNGTNLSYAPAATYTGPETFTYTVSDGVDTATATVTVTVLATGGNTAPTAAADSYSVAENSSANLLAVLANDTDPDLPAQTLTLTQVGVSQPPNHGGSVSVNGNQVSYNPAAGYSGVETFSYTVSDGTATATGTVTVTVNAANTAPTAVDDSSYSVIQSSTGNVLNVLANDSDPDVGDTLTITAVGATSAGGVVTNNGGNLTYDAPATTGPDTFTYTVSDGTTTATATVTVNVQASGGNTAPTAAADSYSVAENSSANLLAVLANDTDPDLPAQTLTLTQVGVSQAPDQGGSVSVNGNQVSYTPAAGYSGVETFSYTVSDGTATATGTVTVTVNAANTAPTAVDDSSYGVIQSSTGTVLNVLANDSDPDVGDTLTITAVDTTSTNGGTVTNNGTSVSYDAPATTGPDTFTYTVSDGTTTATATVTVNVQASGGNTAPTANADTNYSVQVNSSNNLLSVLANDTDPDLPAQTLTITQAGVSQAPTAGGSVAVNALNNGLLYSPAPGYSGTESFSYTVSDGTATATGTVTVTVVGANTVPTAVDDTAFNVRQNSSNNLLDVLANDSDPDVGDTLTISAVGVTSNGGTVTLNGTNDRLIYTPAATYTGTESFSYTISDGTDTATATVTVGVVSGNTLPTAVDDSGISVAANSSGNSLDVLANDSDADVGDTLSITAVGSASNGGAVAVNGTNDRVLYTPAPGYSGNESFTYTVSDGTGTAVATVTVTVKAANTAPTAVDDSGYSVIQSSTGNVLNVLTNDTDPDLPAQTLTITAVDTTGTNGTVTNNGSNLTYDAPATAGPDTFTYTVSDGTATATATVTVSVQASGSNTAPTAAADSYSVAAYSSANLLGVLANDSDPDLPAQTLTLTQAGVSQPPNHGGSVSVNGSNVSYTPAPGYSGVETFSYTVSDGTATATGTVTVTVVAANTAPTAVDDSGINVLAGSSNNPLSVLANDSDPDLPGQTLTITQAGVNQAPTAGGTVTVNGTSDGLLYTPVAASGTESFSYTVSDGVSTATATVTVTIVSANTAPTAVADSYSVGENSSANLLNVLANDSDPDAGTALTLTQVGVTQAPNHGGSVSVSGSNVSYTPAPGYSGTETFSYTVSDGTATATGTVTVTVNAANTAPTAVDDSGYSVIQSSTGNVLNVLANDSDPDVGDTLTITAVGATSNGGTVTNNGSNLTYDAPATTGPDTFTYTVSDGTTTATATVTVTVLGAGGNTAPTANADTGINVKINSSANPLDVLANDTDPDLPAQTLTITQAGVTQAPNHGGTVTVNGSNDGLLYTPAAGYSGTETFSYTVSDGTATATGTVTVTVVGANTVPTAANDTGFNVRTNSSNNMLDVLANDSDADVGDTLTITAVGAASNGGSVTLNGTNDRLIYTPAAAYTGTESFSYTISDGTDTATATVTVGVVSGNTLPTAVDDSGMRVPENSSGNSLDVLANDSDADVGDTLSITAVGSASNGGTVAVNGTSDRVLYTPAPGYSGNESFTYTVSDGTGTAVATVTVTVKAANMPPSAVNDSLTVAQDSISNSLNVLVNDSDNDIGDTLAITNASIATPLGAGGTVTVNGTNDRLVYTPPAGTTGTETLSYTVSDGTTTATATVTVTVSSSDTAPTAAADSYSVGQNSSSNLLSVLANDSDPDVGTTLTLTQVGVPQAPTAGGSVSINGSSVSYTPAAGFRGTETFSYTVSDGTAAATGTVTVTVNASNSAPTPQNDSATVAQDSANNALSVLANDSDPDVGDTLSITAASIATPLGSGGTVTVNGTNDGLIYTPPAGTTGIETLSYTVSDGITTATATVTVTVSGTNTAPTANDDTGYVVGENAGGSSLDVLANDSDPDVGTTLTVTAVGATNNGGTAAISANSLRVIYTPAPNFSGTESFTYTVSDGTATATATVTVTVSPANTVPTAADDSGYNVLQDSSGNVLNVLANDSDADVGDTLTITAVGATSNGGTVTNNGASLSYAPAAAYTGAETFSYTVSDGTGTATANVTVNVLASGSNTAPAATADAYSVAKNSSNNALTVLANDSDADVGDTLTITQAGVTQAPNHGGTVTVNGSNDGLLYTPAEGYSGTETFSYTVSDGTATATGTVTITVVGANTVPTAANDTGFNVRTGSSNNVLDVLANDSDPDVGDTLTITAVGAASAGGTVTLNGTNDRLIYTPAAAYTGTESFSYTISDGTDTATATVTVGVGGNTLPTAVDDAGLHVAMNSSGNSLDVLANDSDADVGETLTITAVGTAGNGGTVAINGTSDRVLYTPAPGFSGDESFTYTVSDGTATATANVTVTVLAANTTPAANDDSFNVHMDSSGNSLDVLANDSDADVGDTLTVSQAGVVQAPTAGGSVSINGTSDRVLYTPAAGYSGPESFSYTLSDGKTTVTATVTVNVVAGDTAPTPVDDSGINIAMNSANNPLSVLANDSDPDVGDTLTITAVGATSAGGTASVNGNGDGLLYTPAVGYSGSESFSYTVSDGTMTAAATVTVNVIAANTPPSALDDTGFNVQVDSSGNLLDVLANDSDADVGDTLTITGVGAASAGGTVTVNGTGDRLIYTPAAAYSGTETFSYSVSDGKSSASATVTVNVVSGNTAPVPADDVSWNVYPGADALSRVSNLASRSLAVAVRQASGLGNADVSGTYNVVQHATYLSEQGTSSAAVDVGYKYGSLDFDGSGSVTGGSLFRKRSSLDVATAKLGSASALTSLPAPATPEAPTGTYAVNTDGTISLSLTIGTESVTATGAVSQDGTVIALTLESSDSGVTDANGGRGILILIRQP